jgi:Camelysin metallo-endopeptidase
MSEEKVKRKPWRALAGGAIVLSLAVIAGQSVLSSLNATAFNTVPQNVNSGTLSLNLANNGVGFSTSVANLAPGDVVNRYVTLTNNGTLDAIGLSLKATETGTATLISDTGTAKALVVTVKSCSVAWTPATGACGGTTTTEINGTMLGTFSTAQNLLNGSMSSAAVKYLQISMQLPDQNETTVNGVPPTPTIQGGAVYVTYTFNYAQRLATTTNS